tara:strand:+ start:8821 stop:9168 length:348 start_codon:yes stop_codon:yes gene_type:complete
MIILFLFVALSRKMITQLSCVNNVINDKEVHNLFDRNYTKGCDFRYKMFENDSILEMVNIIKYFKYKDLLETLENRNVCIQQKLTYIEDYDLLNRSMSINIQNGGLMDDWEFNFK